MLIDKPVVPTDRPLTPRALEFVAACQARYSDIYVFDFIQSNIELAWRMLDGMPRGKFCEWGSGFGMVTGLAEILGFEASGIEIDERLADASRKLLAGFGLKATVATGSYFDLPCGADVVYVYCWPGKQELTEELFESIARVDSTLLICCTDRTLHCKTRSTN